MTKAPIERQELRLELQDGRFDLQDLRRRIYRKAKSEKTHRFWGLFVHVTKRQTLEEAYRIAKRNRGAPGVDGETFEAIECARALLGLEDPAVTGPRKGIVKVAAMTATTHNPFDEIHRASCLRENFTSSSYGEGLETDRGSTQVPRQSLIRQLFFKWIKQHLRVKRFYGQSPNAVKTQIWIAISMYVLVAIVKKRLRLEASLYTLLQILSVTLFEKMPINKALLCTRYTSESDLSDNQLNIL